MNKITKLVIEYCVSYFILKHSLILIEKLKIYERILNLVLK